MTSRRDMRITPAAMTLSSSMILVDQTAVPLAAPHAILGLHAQISQSQWLMTANILPLAALMMPTALAIVSAVYPDEEKGAALGILAGASAFFAALGPVLGGVLTSIDWRLVFLVNVPLAAIAIVLTLRATPELEPDPDASRELDLPGVVTFAVAVGALLFGLNQGPEAGWGRSGR
ncbi:MAG TPA: MFS transporter [Solirubrobacterales bacterium]|jgi:nitrate/nitrite transporter NarK